VFRSESFCKFVKACDLVLVDSDAMMTMFKATFAEHSEKVKVHRSLVSILPNSPPDHQSYPDVHYDSLRAGRLWYTCPGSSHITTSRRC